MNTRHFFSTMAICRPAFAILAALLASASAMQKAYAGDPATGANFHYGLYIKESVQGWSDGSNGQIVGSTGHNWQTDAFRLSGLAFPCEYRIHVKERGWLPWTASGQFTSGNGLRLEAVQFRFPAGIPADTVLLCRAHLQFTGWTETVRIQDMTIVGTTGESRRLEAIQMAVGAGPEFHDVVSLDRLTHHLFQLDRDLRNHTISSAQAMEELKRDPASINWHCPLAVAGAVISADAAGVNCPVASPLCVVALVGYASSMDGVNSSCFNPASPQPGGSTRSGDHGNPGSRPNVECHDNNNGMVCTQR